MLLEKKRYDYFGARSFTRIVTKNMVISTNTKSGDIHIEYYLHNRQHGKRSYNGQVLSFTSGGAIQGVSRGYRQKFKDYWRNAISIY